MSLQYIIDGCNVIHHPDFIRDFPGKSVDLRISLIHSIKIKNLSGGKGLVWVVFDGYPDKAVMSMERANLRVIFSSKESADEKIKRILELTASPRGTIVVSDDKEVKYFTKIMHAKPVSVSAFIGGKKAKPDTVDSDERGINYSQMHQINEELKKIWLK